MRLPLHIVITTHSHFWYRAECVVIFIPYLLLTVRILCIKSLIRLRLLPLMPLRRKLKIV